MLSNNSPNSSQPLNNSQPEQTQVDPQANLQSQLVEERSRRQREDKLFSELDVTKKELESLKSLTTKISENGWDVDTLLKHSPRQEAENPQILQMNQKMQKMEERIALKERQLERKEQLGEIKQYLTENKDSYEFTVLHNYAPKVQELIEHYYENEKKILSYSEAARAIEVELEKHERSKAQTIAQSKKGKEFYKAALEELKVGDVSDKIKETKPHKQAADKAGDAPSDTPSKPKSVVPPMIKKPTLKFQTITQNLSKETEATFNAPAGKAKTKAEAMARVLAKFGG